MGALAKNLMDEFDKKYKAELRYSTASKKFYVYSNEPERFEKFSTIINEHRETPDEAVFAFHEKILNR